MTRKQTIIWAIDPYQNDPKIWKRFKELAITVSKSLKLSLLPVYVADRTKLTSLDSFDSKKIQALLISTEKRMNKLLKSIVYKNIKKTSVLFSLEYDTNIEVSLILKHAYKNKALITIAATSAKSGVERFLQGSFAESLVNQSKIPVILVNPKCSPIKPIKKITFATDFSPLSIKTLKKVCEIAGPIKAIIEIVHVMNESFAYSDPGGTLISHSPLYSNDELSTKEREKTLRKGAHMVATCSKAGVKAKFKLENIGATSVSDVIIKSALSDKANLIALAARGDTSKTHFFGSTSQNIIRNSHVPIWIFHSKTKTTRKS